MPTPASGRDNRLRAPCRTAPFASAETAWFWTASCLRARQNATAAPGPGPCRPEDVVKCLDALYRQRRVELLHVRILRDWGWRGLAPNPAWARERCDWRLWHEALGRLEWPLRVRGIIAERAWDHSGAPLGP
jgi:hypothetical protein